MANVSIAIHGGAGTILKKDMTAVREMEYKSALQQALDSGYRLLSKGAGSVEVVEQTVIMLEDNHLFNAGKGSVFTAEGKHEMDASIMDGRSLKAGAVTMVANVKNPVELARKVMEESEHVFLAGIGAEEFARLKKLEFKNDKYFYDEFRYKQWMDIRGTDRFQLDHSPEEDKFGTVGAVALDQSGNVAAATSTGGMTNKKYGRVGDSPIIGAGTYANNKTCAVSCTGSGEYFIRGVVAYDVSCLMEYKGLDLNEACRVVVHDRLPQIGGDGGLIACDSRGNLALEFNTEGMYRGQQSTTKQSKVEIYK